MSAAPSQVLFLQEAISGTASEFRQPTGQGAPTGQARLPEWCLVNGLWSLFLAFGLVLTALLTRQVTEHAPLRHMHLSIVIQQTMEYACGTAP